MILRFYTLLSLILYPIIVLFILYRLYKGKEQKLRVGERFGISSKSRPAGKLLWIHVASVGEMISVIPFLDFYSKELDYTVLLTSGTVTSASIASKMLPPKVIHQYAPIDSYFVIRKFLKHWQPSLAIFIESEFWPCILSQTVKVCKIVSLNTRISNASFKRWNSFKTLTQQILKNFSTFIPQSLNDKSKLKALGFNNLKYIGNIKYSSPKLNYSAEELEKLKAETKNKKIVLFASSHPGEEEIAADIYNQIQDSKKSVLMLLAPRHPSRILDILDILTKKGFHVARRSSCDPITPTTDFYIVDTIGELGTFFKLSPITIMGGSFIDKVGGHNIIEPAKLKSVVITGPYMHNSIEICDDFKKADAAIFVKDQNECVKAIKSLWNSKKSYDQYINNALFLLKDKEGVLATTIHFINKHYL